MALSVYKTKYGFLYAIFGWLFILISLLFLPILLSVASFIMGYLTFRKHNNAHGKILMWIAGIHLILSSYNFFIIGIFGLSYVYIFGFSIFFFIIFLIVSCVAIVLAFISLKLVIKYLTVQVPVWSYLNGHGLTETEAKKMETILFSVGIETIDGVTPFGNWKHQGVQHFRAPLGGGRHLIFTVEFISEEWECTKIELCFCPRFTAYKYINANDSILIYDVEQGGIIKKFEDALIELKNIRLKGKKQSQDMVYCPDEAVNYKGEFKEGEPRGHARAYYEGGIKRYEGEFKDRWPYGKGTSYYEDGKRYEGEFKNGIPHGQGVKYFENGMIMHEGKFKDGIPHGQGTMYKENGMIMHKGEFKDGIPHGQGTMYKENGTRLYKGKFEKGKMHGQGIEYYEDGMKRYEGEFKDGVYLGKGTLFDEDGVKLHEGEFKNGKPNRQKTGYDEDG